MTEYRRFLEERRLRAVPQLKAGVSARMIAQKFEVSRLTAYRWRRQLERTGSLAATKAPGRARRLTAAQEQKLRALLLELPGLTTHLVAVLIQERYGVRYSADHAGRLRHRLLGTKPRRRREPQECHA